tara:strand:+ start:2194 stop:2871 length:678 start_codon:yes stop_codon:yes gene_type:complete
MAYEEYRKSIPIQLRTQVYLDRLKEEEAKEVTPAEKAQNRVKGITVGYKALDMFDKYNESIANKLNLIDKSFEIGKDAETGATLTKELFQTSTPFKGDNFFSSMIGEKLKDPFERIEVIPGMEDKAVKVLEGKVSSGEMTKLQMDKILDKTDNVAPEAFSKVSDVMGSTVVSKGLPGAMAIADVAEGDAQGAAHNVARMFYKELAATGPIGWAAIGLNELIDLFS